MSRKITNLKFWKRPMTYSGGRFWISLPTIGATVSIHEETPTSKCNWTISEAGHVVACAASSGVIAARNAAQVWLETRAELTQRMAAKGGK